MSGPSIKNPTLSEAPSRGHTNQNLKPEESQPGHHVPRMYGSAPPKRQYYNRAQSRLGVVPALDSVSNSLHPVQRDAHVSGESPPAVSPQRRYFNRVEHLSRDGDSLQAPLSSWPSPSAVPSEHLMHEHSDIVSGPSNVDASNEMRDSPPGAASSQRRYVNRAVLRFGDSSQAPTPTSAWRLMSAMHSKAAMQEHRDTSKMDASNELLYDMEDDSPPAAFKQRRYVNRAVLRYGDSSQAQASTSARPLLSAMHSKSLTQEITDTVPGTSNVEASNQLHGMKDDSPPAASRQRPYVNHVGDLSRYDDFSQASVTSQISTPVVNSKSTRHVNSITLNASEEVMSALSGGSSATTASQRKYFNRVRSGPAGHPQTSPSPPRLAPHSCAFSETDDPGRGSCKLSRACGIDAIGSMVIEGVCIACFRWSLLGVVASDGTHKTSRESRNTTGTVNPMSRRCRGR